VFKIKRHFQSQAQIDEEKLCAKKQKLAKEAQVFETEEAKVNYVKKHLMEFLNPETRKINKSTFRLNSFRLRKYSSVSLDFLPKSI
jgi:hypothetical protein